MKLQEKMCALVQFWEESGLTKREFLADKAVGQPKFNYWLYKYRKRAESGQLPCSTYLSRLNEGDEMSVRVIKNKNFHFPSRPNKSLQTAVPEVILVSTGTGIAPFLGMLDQNRRQIPVRMYWGAKLAPHLSSTDCMSIPH